MRTTITFLVLLALAVAACGDGESTDSLPPLDGDGTVLEVWVASGMPAPGESDALVYRLDGDRRLTLRDGSTLAVDDETFAEVQRLVDAGGLSDIVAEENRQAEGAVLDAPMTTVRLFDPGGEHSFAILALGAVETSDVRVTALRELVTLFDGLAGDDGPTGGVQPPDGS